MNGYIPVFKIEGETLPETWEKAVLKTWQEGIGIKTEYDRPRDPESKDSTMIMVIKSPLKEPRIHRAFPGSLEDLEIYRQEVVEGVHDHWIKPEEGKWTYTYHKRLFGYEIEHRQINQMDYIIKKLAKIPYSRRGQAITWNPLLDPGTYDSPCLQRLWFRITSDEQNKLYLNMNTHWRSRDAFKASFMNMFALIDLQQKIANQISSIVNKEIFIGRYVDISDSFHIYGAYFEEMNRFQKTIKNRSFAQKTWTMEFAEPFFTEARKRLEQEKKD